MSQHEKMKLGFEGQIKQLKKDVLSNSREITRAGSTAAAASASSAPDKHTIEKLRAYYTKKIQDQEKKYEAQLRAAKRGNVGKDFGPTPSGDRNVTYERVQELEQLVSKQKEMIRMMEVRC